MDIQKELAKLGIDPDVSKDQFFLTDVSVARKLVDVAEVNKGDGGRSRLGNCHS